MEEPVGQIQAVNKVTNSELYTAAQLMLRYHGPNALTSAVGRAEKLQQLGNEHECLIWLRIMVAIVQLYELESSGPNTIH
jgi:hypothetical protein